MQLENFFSIEISNGKGVGALKWIAQNRRNVSHHCCFANDCVSLCLGRGLGSIHLIDCAFFQFAQEDIVVFRKGRGCTQFVHDRGRVAIYPRNAGTEHVGFAPTRQTSFAPSAKRREVFGESHEG